MKRKYVKSFSFGNGSDPCWLYFHNDNRYQSPDNPWYIMAFLIHNWSRMELLTFVLFDNPWKMRFSSALSLTYLWSRRTRSVTRWQHWNGTWPGPRVFIRRTSSSSLPENLSFSRYRSGRFFEGRLSLLFMSVTFLDLGCISSGELLYTTSSLRAALSATYPH